MRTTNIRLPSCGFTSPTDTDDNALTWTHTTGWSNNNNRRERMQTGSTQPRNIRLPTCGFTWPDDIDNNTHTCIHNVHIQGSVIVITGGGVCGQAGYSGRDQGISGCCHVGHLTWPDWWQRTHTHLTALFPGLPRWASTRKAKPIWILLKQETVSGSGICRAICKSAPRSRQITMPAPHHSVFYRPDVFLAAQPTVSKHWRQTVSQKNKTLNSCP